MKKAIKLAISSSGDTVESTVDPRFGRSKYFMLYDGASEEYTTLVNAARGAGGGAGVQAAETVIQSGASVVLTGNVGPKAFQVLSSADVLVVTEVTGTVKEAVGKFLSGEYPAADTSNVSARIGQMGGTSMVIAVASSKGDAGKTTVSTNLAYSYRDAICGDCSDFCSSNAIAVPLEIAITDAMIAGKPPVDTIKGGVSTVFRRIWENVRMLSELKIQEHSHVFAQGGKR